MAESVDRGPHPSARSPYAIGVLKKNQKKKLQINNAGSSQEDWSKKTRHNCSKYP